MATVAAKKKPARKSAAPSRAVKAPQGMAVSPVTGLFYVPLKPGQKPVSRNVLKTALADSL